MSKKCPQKAIIFASVSSVNQVEGHSLNAQVSRLQAYCKQNNLEVVKEFQILGKRGQFLKMINFIKEQQTKIILICDSIDRFQTVFREVALINDLVNNEIIDIYCLREGLLMNKTKINKCKIKFILY